MFFLELNPLNGNTENRAVNSADMHKVANARQLFIKTNTTDFDFEF